MQDKKIIIFSPSQFSLYTLCVAELCKRNNISVSTIIVLNLFNFKRFRSEFKRDGYRLLNKIWKKLILKDKAYKSNKRISIASLKKDLGIKENNIIKYAKNNKIKIIHCNNFNSDIIIDDIKNNKSDIALFTGGGIIRKNLISQFKIGIINCHMGILPHYRGMDVVEWPILENNFHQIGLTTHLIDVGIDTGDIIETKTYKMSNFKDNTISQIRSDFEPIMCNMIIDACRKLINRDIELKKQQFNDGKQYFIMHHKLKALSNNLLIKKYENNR